MSKVLSFSIFVALLIVLLGILTIAKTKTKTNETAPLKVVEQVDVKKYMGLWYEIATITMWFQKDCAGGTNANYELRDDGTVKVVNSCYTAENKLKQSTGRAWLVDASTKAKLKVSFLPGGLKLAGGDYWIIDLGPNYEYAVVGHPSRKYGWILSRTKELPQDTLKGIITRLEAQGYDFSKFTMTNQKEYGK
jgi:apolipoprotein D and lipocalin family protein